MGIVKQMWMEEMERGYGRPEGDICSDCVSDDWLKQWIEDEASSNTCSFCDAQADHPIAASFEAFVGQVMNGVRFYWNHPDDEGIMYVSAEGGYQASISDSSEVIWDLGVSEREAVVEALVDAIDDNGWVARDFYVGTEEDRLVDGWDRFTELIKHHSRFFFLRPEPDDHDFGADIKPHAMLDTIADVIVRKLGDYGLVSSITTDQRVVRVRLDAEREHTTASALGSPPAEFARRSNRMSPAGVPMFYGAFNIQTALAETFDPDISEDPIVSAGTFKPVRDLRILDLANLPEIPSIYDEDRNYLVHALRFLHAFAHDISKPIERDGREHVEYVPTQIVTEYFRRVFEIEGQRLDGIGYRSSRADAENAFVLFCENEQCIDGEPTGEEAEMLQLVAVEHFKASSSRTADV
jgi:hypothetical protein